MPQVNWVERQVRRVDRFQQRHVVLVFILGFVPSGNPALREQPIDSALGNIPVIGPELRSQVHPLEGSTTAPVIGIAGTIYGSLGIGFAAQNAMNTV